MGLFLCGNEDNWIKFLQKVHVTKLVTPKGQGPTMVTTSIGTFEILQKCKLCYKKGNKYHHTIDKNFSVTD